MRAAVIYESMFGNTRTVAEALSEELAKHMEVELYEAGEAPASIDASIGLVVLGAPTHGFTLSRPSSRQEAAGMTPDELVSTGIGVREWLEAAKAAPGTRAAAFDTRISHVPGSAARAATRRLRRSGFAIIARPASFMVEKTLGPLVPGQLDRVRSWATAIAAAAHSTSGPAEG
ncbi:flavodoxin family protein [Glycomyces tritici]|uniref:Flavodoxin domain-containing protein n=1 Tax=Glycomyces tritici TaxID=2665176 RepID=A0ABT7YWY3_9ACTN|nr:flavodoxin domain-containing protein [Glycomyces tritici]MDN3243155.1 flavodoxin domain-containing protein [Glycomyces tritici]